VHFAYGRTSVYRGIDLEVERGERIVLVGPNGAGKSTLLKLLADKLSRSSGEARARAQRLGRLLLAVPRRHAEARSAPCSPKRSTPRRRSPSSVRTLLGSFLFSGDSVFKKVEVLSGGEKSRLALVKLLLDPPNLLLMDEPTTHLDMGSIDALVDALKQFEGTLVFISHDVHFIRALANKVIHVAAASSRTTSATTSSRPAQDQGRVPVSVPRASGLRLNSAVRGPQQTPLHLRRKRPHRKAEWMRANWSFHRW
jgi:ATP-binding cassette subfamily F protein 3